MNQDVKQESLLDTTLWSLPNKKSDHYWKETVKRNHCT